MENLKRLVQEIKRRQVLAGGIDMPQAWAVVLLMDMYDREPSIQDLGRGGGVSFVVEDDAGRTIRLAYDKVTDLSWDRYVSYSPNKAGTADLFGWTTRERLLESQGVNGTYRLEPDFLFDFPKTFDFKTPCGTDGRCLESGVWDYDKDAWECFACGKFREDREDREQVLIWRADQKEKSGNGVQRQKAVR